MNRENYLLSAKDKVVQCPKKSVPPHGPVVPAEEERCRDPERCPRMELNRQRTQASSSTISASENSGSARANREGWDTGKKGKKRQEGGLLYQQQKHYIIDCFSGRLRAVDRGWEVFPRCTVTAQLYPIIVQM